MNLGPGPALLAMADLADSVLASDLGDGLTQTEVMLADSVASPYPFVAEVSAHLLAAGGKRFRPLLCLLSAQFGDPRAHGVVPAAVVVELTHLATLYHDDVMDEAPKRRGAASVNRRWGNSVAILTGDLLFARASDILADLGPEAVRIQARTFARLCTGQIRETVGPLGDEDPIEHHLQVLGDKTGSLIAASCRLGAMMAGAAPDTMDALTEFGERIGVAFQLADDLVDISSESRESGKTPGTDLREGVATLAVLIARQSVDPADSELLELTAAPIPDDGDHSTALGLLRAHPAMGQAQARAREWADAARAPLLGLPDTPARAALEQLCDYVVARTG